MILAAVGCAALAGWLGLPWAPSGDDAKARSLQRGSAPEEVGGLKRYRPVWAVLAGLGSVAFVGGPAGPPLGVVVAMATWAFVTRAEAPVVRRRREQRERELPDVVGLLAATLLSGCSVSGALDVVCSAHPGPAADLLAAVPGRIALGLDPPLAWAPVEAVPELAGLARTMVRAQTSGSSVATAVARLAVELDQRAAAGVEQRARSVGVRAAMPLGLCFLPSFLFLGVVPVAASLMATLRW